MPYRAGREQRVTELDGCDLERLYRNRFSGEADYRKLVWGILAEYFSQWIRPDDSVLDLGAGYCEFINAIRARARYAIDLNPDTREHAAPGVSVLLQDCSEPWRLPSDSIDCIFTSNFLEHLHNKEAATKAALQAHRCLKPRGLLLALGPNIRYLTGAYWDFIDHYLPLTDLSISELLSTCGFTTERRIARFLPYTMSKNRKYPGWMLRAYLRTPALWPIFGKQFLVVARKG
jgi:SAM-dependent methyltransferase